MYRYHTSELAWQQLETGFAMNSLSWRRNSIAYDRRNEGVTCHNSQLLTGSTKTKGENKVSNLMHMYTRYLYVHEIETHTLPTDRREFWEGPC